MAKLTGMGKEAAININSCDADKIIRAFKEIGNFMGSNIDGFGHQVQQAFTMRVQYDCVAAEPKDPQQRMVKVEAKNKDDEEQFVHVKPEVVPSLSIVTFEVQAKNLALKIIKYVDSCVKVYSCIWTLCTQATRDKLKTFPGFTDTKRAKDFIQLTIAIKEITLQFESNKDLLTALTRSLSRILECQQGPTELITKHEQQYTAATAIFFAYGGSLAFPAVYEREMPTIKLTEMNADAATLKALLDKIKKRCIGQDLP